MYVIFMMVIGMLMGVSLNKFMGVRLVLVINLLMMRFVDVLINDIELVRMEVNVIGISRCEGEILDFVVMLMVIGMKNVVVVVLLMKVFKVFIESMIMISRMLGFVLV